MIWTLLVLSNVFASVLGISVNYCGARMCSYTDAHTFCRFTEGPGPDCIGYTESPLTKEEQARVIARLNRRRSEAASGKLLKLPSAGNMLKLRWVEELAREAQLWADQCRPPRTPEERDTCRDLYSITIGQCVASVVGEAPGLRVESMIDMWYMQNILYKGNATSYVPHTNESGYYADFGQILWANTYMVGCGRSRFMTPSQGRLRSVERLVCNFAPRGPPAFRALWSPGLPASACSSRSLPDPAITTLCTYQSGLNKTHDGDKSMTIEEHIALNTILEIEENYSLNYHGGLDQLFLTKLAIVTMESTDISTPDFNSIQNQDFAELISFEDAKADVYKIVQNVNISQNPNNTLTKENVENITNTTKTLKKKANIVGRPKSYNIEDLNDEINNEERNTQEILTEETTQKEYDLYVEYGLLESDDINLTTFAEFLTESTVEPFSSENKSNELNGNMEETTIFLNHVDDNTTLVDVTTDSDILFNIVSVYGLEKAKQMLEYYANDTETVQQLQEALARLERAMEPKFRGPQGKVRRDLRDISEEVTANDNSIADSENDGDAYEEIEKNKTADQGSLMNMVLRYMPYLKNYENELLGKSESGSKKVVPYYIFILSTTFIFV